MINKKIKVNSSQYSYTFGNNQIILTVSPNIGEKITINYKKL